ncbi:MAG: JDVT-CTERM system CAAX-type protease [Campylobacterales bacterium]|nr:JDVT-CTERM system CAAX-type protease [Campylobacterales bacterium]
MRRKELYYAAALIAAPLFCFFYSWLFGSQPVTTKELFFKKETFIWTLIIFPVIEELTFRGVIQEYIGRKTKQYLLFFHLSLANLLTSLLFSAIHLIYHAPLWAGLVFFPSLIFGYFKEQYQSIIPSILLHIFYNLNFIWIIGKAS